MLFLHLADKLFVKHSIFTHITPFRVDIPLIIALEAQNLEILDVFGENIQTLLANNLPIIVRTLSNICILLVCIQPVN